MSTKPPTGTALQTADALAPFLAACDAAGLAHTAHALVTHHRNTGAAIGATHIVRAEMLQERLTDIAAALERLHQEVYQLENATPRPEAHIALLHRVLREMHAAAAPGRRNHPTPTPAAAPQPARQPLPA